MMDRVQAPVAAGELVLSLRGISKHFGAVSALTEIDLDVHAGEVVALVGDNGAGKSTLIKILAGVHQASAGTMTFRGQAVTLADRLPGSRALRESGRCRQYLPRQGASSAATG
jgi:D-xylose transport system ATP-binding protein